MRYAVAKTVHHLIAMAAASVIGIRVRSGWASAILIACGKDGPRYLHRARLVLSDPKVPKSAQPYHRGFGSLQKDHDLIERLTAVVQEATAAALAAFLHECRQRGHRPSAIALVVGSTIDPAKVSNEHVRAHASEGQLFRTALAQAGARAALPVTVTREGDLPSVVAATLGTRAPVGAADAPGRSYIEPAAILSALRSGQAGGAHSSEFAPPLLSRPMRV